MKTYRYMIRDNGDYIWRTIQAKSKRVAVQSLQETVLEIYEVKL